MKYLDNLVAVLIVIGAINWGCVGFFNWNLVNFLFQNYVVERVIYAAVGVAGIYEIIFHWIICRACCHSKRK